MPRTAALLVPTVADADVYLIECRFKDGSTAFVERDAARTNRKDTLADIASGEEENVVRVIAFNPFEGWSRDVSEDFARDILAAEINERGEVRRHVIDFIEQHLGCAAVATAEREAA